MWLILVVNWRVGYIANRDVVEEVLEFSGNDKIEPVKLRRQYLTESERANKKKQAVHILENGNLKSLAKIRSITSMTQEKRMGNELATETAICIGWNINRNAQLTKTETELAIKIINAGISPDDLTKQRRGYLQVHYNDWVKQQLTNEIVEATESWIMEGHGKESTAIDYDFLIGEILNTLLDKIAGQVWSNEALSETVLTALNETNLLARLQTGQAGVNEAKQVRFLHCANPEYVIKWIRKFIPRWYPMRIAKSKDNYALVKSKAYELRIDAFHAYLEVKDFSGNIVQSNFKLVQLPRPQNKVRTQAERMRYEGATYKEIAKVTGKHHNTISIWCKHVRTPKQRLREKAIQMGNSGMDLKKIAAELDVGRSTVWSWISR